MNYQQPLQPINVGLFKLTFIYKYHNILFSHPIPARFLMSARRKQSYQLNSRFLGYLKLKEMYPIFTNLAQNLYSIFMPEYF